MKSKIIPKIQKFLGHTQKPTPPKVEEKVEPYDPGKYQELAHPIPPRKGDEPVIGT